MKPIWPLGIVAILVGFSAQPRADGDEADLRLEPRPDTGVVSVLNREPMGMKRAQRGCTGGSARSFSAQPRADGDEARVGIYDSGRTLVFQCSTASRWG